MPARSPVLVPTEIWLEIAHYLPQSEVRRLSSLCWPFRQLWVERILLPTGTSYFVGTSNLSERDWRTVAYDIWKALHARIESGDAAHTRSIMFYSPPNPEPRRGPSFLDNIVRSVGSKVKILMFTSWLPSAYKKYISVESLVFLHEPPLIPSGPTCYRYLAVPSIWSTFSANLRELAISVSYSDALAHILPLQITPLPKLEIMRVGYLYRTWDPYTWNNCPPEPMLTRLAHLYANRALQVLELRIVYPGNPASNGGPFLVQSLLPKSHIFPQLRRFWIVTERRLNTGIDASQTVHIESFIRAHVNTLRSVKVHKFPDVVVDLFVRTPYFLQPPSFSVAFDDLATLQKSASATAKNALVELQLHTGPAIPSQETFRNLRRLAIRVRELSLESFEYYAKELSQLISLSVKYVYPFWTSDDISGRIANPPNSILLQWKLKDLTIYPTFGLLPIPPNYPLMREVAQLIPSVESFAERGDMLKPEDWEAKWPWTRNVYIDALMDGTPA
ncbi:hypothetical protein DL96DRAFT_1678056 [Flagelloscypha sp. PMI_526]|nr:hypothetical protein DL96DRAFT_1678056 [Flagelloscypha sp. PMI_526]